MHNVELFDTVGTRLGAS